MYINFRLNKCVGRADLLQAETHIYVQAIYITEALIIPGQRPKKAEEDQNGEDVKTADCSCKGINSRCTEEGNAALFPLE